MTTPGETCASCGAARPAGAAFCPACGRPYAASLPAAPAAPAKGPTAGGAIKQGFGWATGCLLFIVVIVVAVAVLGGLGKSATTTPPARATLTPTIAPPPAAATTLLDMKGNGIKRSTKFTTSGDWAIDWSYDCSAFLGGSGNFQIFVEGDTTDVATNELGKSGSGTQPEYTGAGTFYLEMNSECIWHVTVKG